MGIIPPGRTKKIKKSVVPSGGKKCSLPPPPVGGGGKKKFGLRLEKFGAPPGPPDINSGGAGPPRSPPIFILGEPGGSHFFPRPPITFL